MKTDYAPGEAPRATATIPADDTAKEPTVEAAATKSATGSLAATGDDAALWWPPWASRGQPPRRPLGGNKAWG